jgi:hypothetical protein
MECPKCRMEQSDGNLLCDYCGIVFAKYRLEALAGAGPAAGPAQATTEPHVTVYAPPARRLAAWLRARLFDVRREPPAALAARGVLLALLAAWGVRLMTTSIESNGVGESFLHLVNLPFHEAGHVLFTPFGDFVRVLGGTLGQLLMPIVCCLVLLLKTRDPFGAAVALWWFGENFLDIAPYIDDAGTGELPLLGGNTGESTPYGFHDWEYLMTETGHLGREHDLARASQALGSALIVLALVWMAVTLYRSWSVARATRGSEETRRAA